MTDFVSIMAGHDDHNLSDDHQKQVGAPIGNDMSALHKQYLANVIAKLDAKEIEILKPETFLVTDIYNTLPELDRSAVDLSLFNIVHQVARIEDFFRDTQTPNAAPQLQTMIDHLWQQKNRVEEKYGKVFKI